MVGRMWRILLAFLVYHGPQLWFRGHAAYVFNASELEMVGNERWGVGSAFHRLHGLPPAHHPKPHHGQRDNRTSPSRSDRWRQRQRQRKLATHTPSDGNAKKTVNVAFYHVYAAGSSFEGIVTEQRHVLQQTGAYDDLDAIFYNTIDGASDTSPYTIDDPKFQRLYRFAEQGEEVYTLGMMYRFCQSYPYANVLYFHDKGSYHPNAANTRFRQLLDCHVLNPQCLRALQTGAFDTCGMRISPIPHPHYSGNFFWATCAYVASLVDPWSPLTNATFAHINENVLSPCIGVRERYFAETWVTSGPTIRPADCTDAHLDSSYLYGYVFPGSFFSVCPRADVHTYGTGQCALTATWTNASLFVPAFLHMKGLERGECGKDLQADIQQRSYLWYGQPAVSYSAWVQPYLDQIKSQFVLVDNFLVRRSHERTIYCYQTRDQCFHMIPDWNTFVKMGFDTDQVHVVVPIQSAYLKFCEDPMPTL